MLPGGLNDVADGKVHALKTLTYDADGSLLK